MLHYTTSEAIEFIEENDVKFIRLAFCDIFGVQKNISIMPGELARAFREGISFDAAAFPGFASPDGSDLLLFPDPTTLSILPWRPSQGRVVRFYCEIRQPDGQPFPGDGRFLLRQAVRRARERDLTCKFGTECEFYLFQRDEAGYPTHLPHDRAGYCDIAPLDRAENVRRQVCLTLEEMGIQPERSHHEQGPGQNEIDFQYASPLAAADNLTTFKSVIKTVASLNGLFASFLPKPIPGQPGSGLHINISLFQGGRNIIETEKGVHSEISEQFISGILRRAHELAAFLNPLTNSYARFGEFEAPRFVSWSHQNRSQLVRIPAAHGDFRRMELRAPDPTANPYLAFTLLIHAGLEGIADRLTLPPACNHDLFTAPADVLAQYELLPGTLHEALEYTQHSAFISSIIPEPLLSSYLAVKAREWETVSRASDHKAAEDDLYFARW